MRHWRKLVGGFVFLNALVSPLIKVWRRMDTKELRIETTRQNTPRTVLTGLSDKMCDR